MKLKWRVQPAPTGRYRAFESRGWPMASYAHDDYFAAASLDCDDDYEPRKVKTGDHKAITIRVAKWYTHEERGTRAAFEWYRLNKKAETLKEAKELAAKFIETHQDWWPEEVRNDV